jgi:hypothetical protein
VFPEWANRNLAGNAFASNGDNPLNFVSHAMGSLQSAEPRSPAGAEAVSEATNLSTRACSSAGSVSTRLAISCAMFIQRVRPLFRIRSLNSAPRQG